MVSGKKKGRGIGSGSGSGSGRCDTDRTLDATNGSVGRLHLECKLKTTYTAAGGIWVRDIPTPRPLFPQSHACYNVIEFRNRNRDRSLITEMEMEIEIAMHRRGKGIGG